MVLKPLLKSLPLLSLHMKTVIYEHIGQGVLMLLKGTLWSLLLPHNVYGCRCALKRLLTLHLAFS